MSQRKKPNQTVQSLDRAIDIIEKLVESKQGLGVTQISDSTGLHKSTVYRLLSTLNYRGFVKKDTENNKYTIGLKLFEIGSKVLNNLDLRTESKPYLMDLMNRTGETIHLGVMNNYEVVYIDKVEGTETIGMTSKIGRRVPAHCTSLGKTILAYSNEEYVDELLEKKGLPRYTAQTIVEPQKLKEHLKEIKKKGYAVDDEEQELGIRCIAAPIFNYNGEVMASFSISGPASRMSEERVENLSNLITRFADKISSEFGYHG